MGWCEHLLYRLGATLLVTAPGLAVAWWAHTAWVVAAVRWPPLPPVHRLVRVEGQRIKVVRFSRTIVPTQMADIAERCVHQFFVPPEWAADTVLTSWH